MTRSMVVFLVLPAFLARYVLVVLDEASGIPEQLWTAAETLVFNEGSRLLAIGNPDDPTGRYAKVCAPNSGWHVIGISGFDTPNFTGEEVPASMGEQLLSPTWVEERRTRWGEGSPLWTAKVLGRFPDRSEDSLIPLSWIERARERDLPAIGNVYLGVDVARFGSDETVVVSCEGGKVRVVLTRHGDDTMQTCGHVTRAIRESGAVLAQIDGIGVGAGVVDRLREEGLPVEDLVGSSRARDSQRFANARAEWFWDVRTAFEHGRIDLDPRDEVLAEQLASIRYKVNSRGQIQIESKEDMRARGVGSPDQADALMLCLAVPAEEENYLVVYDERVNISLY